MAKDYTYLEGKEVVVEIPHASKFGEPFKEKASERACIVAGCDYDIGITIVDKADRKRRVICFSSNHVPTGGYLSPRAYQSIFQLYAKSIEKGKITIEDLHWSAEIYRKGTKDNIGPICTANQSIPASSCAFSQ
jgi:hypothetical protein